MEEFNSFVNPVIFTHLEFLFSKYSQIKQALGNIFSYLMLY